MTLTQPAGGTAPAPVGATVPRGRDTTQVSVIIRYPPTYHLVDESITVDRGACKAEVYSHVLYKTGSPTVALAIANQALC